ALLGADGRDLTQDRALLWRLLETSVHQELRRHASWHTGSFRFHLFGDRDRTDVALLIEQGARRIVGVEVKAAASINRADFKGLRKLREASGDRFAAGVVLYDGEATASFGGNLFAVPIRSLWETVAKT